MSRLRDIAAVIRSKNAGPLYLTLDVMLPNPETFRRVLDSRVLEPSAVAALYGIAVESIETIHQPLTHTVKVTIRRPIIAGDVADTDLYGAQLYVPLLDIEIA